MLAVVFVLIEDKGVLDRDEDSQQQTDTLQMTMNSERWCQRQTLSSSDGGFRFWVHRRFSNAVKGNGPYVARTFDSKSVHGYDVVTSDKSNNKTKINRLIHYYLLFITEYLL